MRNENKLSECNHKVTCKNVCNNQKTFVQKKCVELMTPSMRMTATTSKLQYHHSQNNAVLFLVPLLAFILKEATALPPLIKIGAIFIEDQRNSDIEIAFKYAVHKINKDNVILPNTKLEYDIQYVPKDDSFHASKKVCRQVQNGVQAIFGPSDPILGAHINSICNALDIPHLEARIDIDLLSSASTSRPVNQQQPSLKDNDNSATSSRKEFTLNLYPSQSMVNIAIQDVMSFLNWTKVAIIYETKYDLLKLRELIKMPQFEFYVQQADPSSYSTVLKEIKQKEIHNIIIDIHPEYMAEFLNVILRLQMNEHQYHYLYTTFDIDAFDLDDFKYNFVNITAFRLVDVNDIGVREILKDINRYQQLERQQQNEQEQLSPTLPPKLQQTHQHRQMPSKGNAQSNMPINGNKFIKTGSVLMYDLVHVFAIGLQTLEQSHIWRLSNMSCADEKPWDGGLSLINYINAVEWKGLSGPIEFKEGRRIQFKLDLVKLKHQLLTKVGEWTPHGRLNVTDRLNFFESGRLNVTLVVITILETPYVMLRSSKITKHKSGSNFVPEDINRASSSSLKSATNSGVPYADENDRSQITTPESLIANTNLVNNTSIDNGNLLLSKQQTFFNSYDYKKQSYSQQIANEFNETNLFRFKGPSLNDSSSPISSAPTQQSPHNENDHFEGFCIDLLRLIAEMVGFDYSIELVPDGKYGVYDLETGEWNGLVRELMDKKADLAVGSMTINYARESVIDFTKPFMNLGISILFKVPTTQPTRLFSFMNPLAVDIWLYVLAAYCLVSLTIYIVARFSPYEWHNPHPCDTENNVIENQFSIANSFWFTIGTLMQQGSDLNPKATSTRIVGGIWWFFTLIMISSYTANLAAFLTVERMITPIENAEDLAGQTEISYGTLESGSTMTFFRDSMIETYKKMWRFMENKKTPVFTSTYEEGIRRVLDGNYAFLMESTMLDYIVQRDCNLTQIGTLLDTKGYGIATPMGSPWRDKISLAILELQEKGEIQMLYDKWWKNGSDTCTIDKIKESSKANALGVDNIGGIFVVLLCGLAFSVLIAILEFFHNSRHQQKSLLYIENMCADNSTMNEAIKGRAFGGRGKHVQPSSMIVQNQSVFSDMTEELCFAFRCQGSRQRPAFKRYCVKCQQLQHNLQQPLPSLPQPTTTAGIATSSSTADKLKMTRTIATDAIEMQELSRTSFSRSMPHIIGHCCDASNVPSDRSGYTEAASPFE